MSDDPFSEAYAEQTYEQVQTVEDEVVDQMGTPKLVIFRLTGRRNTVGSNDSEFLERLLMSAPAITDGLNHVTDGWNELRWSTIAEEDGVPVWYLCAYVDSSLGRYDFMRVIYRHVSHSPVAFKQDHDIDDSITIRNIGGSNPLIDSETLLPVADIHEASESPSDSPIASYVLSNLLGFRDDCEATERLQRTIENCSTIDSQFLPGPTFEDVLEYAESDWDPIEDTPDDITSVSYGADMLTGDEHLSNGLDTEAVA